MPLITLEGYEDFGELVTGLQWFSGLEHRTKAEVKKNVKSHQAKFSASREIQWEDSVSADGISEGIHHGLYLGKGSPVGKYAAADLLAVSHPDEEIYAVVPLFSEDEIPTYWYVGIVSGRVVAGTDIVGDWDTVFNHVQSVYSGAAWMIDAATLYLPEDKLGLNVGVDACSINQLDLFSEGSKSLSNVVQRTSSRAPIYLSLFVLLCAGGYYALDPYKKDAAKEIVFTPKISFEEIENQFIEKEKASLSLAGPVFDPTSTSISVVDFSEENDLNIYGWNLQKVVLDLTEPVKEGNSLGSPFITAHYSRAKGNVITAQSKADSLDGIFKMSNSGNDVYIRYPVTKSSISWLSLDAIESSTMGSKDVTDAISTLQDVGVEFSPDEQQPLPRTTSLEVPDIQFQMGGNYFIPVDHYSLELSGSDTTTLEVAMNSVARMGLSRITRLDLVPVNGYQYSWSASVVIYLLRNSAKEESGND